MEPFEVPSISTTQGDVVSTIEFSYADANFALSPYSSTMGGFMSKKECKAIESTLTYERADEMTNHFKDASSDIQEQYWEFVKGMVEATSMFTLDDVVWEKPAFAVDHTDRSRRSKESFHSYSPAVLRVEVTLSVPGGETLFNPASLFQSLAYGVYGADATLFTVDNLRKLADSFSTITTTTVRTTQDSQNIAVAVENVTASGIAELQQEKTELQAKLAILMNDIEESRRKIDVAKAEKDLACVVWTDAACPPAK